MKNGVRGGKVRYRVLVHPSEKQAQDICALNAQCFGATDEYSHCDRMSDALWQPGSRVITARVDSRLIGFVLLLDRGRHYEGVRIGTHLNHRRRGIAAHLLRRALQLARDNGKGYRTYVLASNVPSVNLHTRAGLVYASHDASAYAENPRLWFTLPRTPLDMELAA